MEERPQVLDQQFGFGQYVLLISGLGLILTAVLNPEGIAGGFRLTVFAARDKIVARRDASSGPGGTTAVSDEAEVHSDSTPSAR